MRVGVLAVQGAFEAHRRALRKLGVAAALVRTPGALDALDALVLPGGESGAHLRLLRENGLLGALRRFQARGGALFGTCAGAILLARHVSSPAQESLAAIDIDVTRNAYGRQRDSFEASVDPGALGGGPLRLVLIRAPRIERVGAGVRVLVRHDRSPVAVSEGRVLAATFHPELTEDVRLHAWFLERVAVAPAREGQEVLA